ncbi:GNAT family N-acetyltransferase [Alishewanella longhuensis]
MWQAKLTALLEEAKRHQIRLPVWLEGEQTELLHFTRQLLDNLQPKSCWWLGLEAPTSCLDLQQSKAHQLLGTECDWLVINTFGGFNADKIAASAGAVKAGGLWLLLTPPATHWQRQPNPGHQQLLSYPYQQQTRPGAFTAFWLRQLQQTNLVRATAVAIGDLQHWPQPTYATTPNSGVTAEVAERVVNTPCKTAGQEAAVNAIIKVATGHRRRPLLLLADRGCGKSTALGLAAAKLAAAGKTRLLVTAPTKIQAAVALLHFAANTHNDSKDALQFMAIDELLAQKPTAELLLIDEAAAIPAQLLQQLLDQYNRVVFASTEHGYEGTGRGFQLRFQPYLAKRCPDWRQLRLTEPIRYQQHDPLEQLIRQSFLLTQVQPDYGYQPESTTELHRYTSRCWLQQPAKLQQVFSLLSLAHYQTQVKDLVALLENPALCVYTLEQAGQVLGCALLSLEGQFSQELAEQIYRGERRVQGHLLAQSLAFHLAEPALATLPLARVMRIAIWPQLQQQGLGSRLLTAITESLSAEHFAYLGSSFAATAQLARFWEHNGFAAIRLGHQLDKASAEPSLLVLKNLTSSTTQAKDLARHFSAKLYAELTEYPAMLEPALLLQLIQPPIEKLSVTELKQLALFAQGKRPYELVVAELQKWFNQHRLLVGEAEANVFIAKLWQKLDWQSIATRLQYAGKAQLVAVLQQAVAAKLIN